MFICVFIQVGVIIFKCAQHLNVSSFTKTWHTLSPGVVLAQWEHQQCGTGLFLCTGQIWAMPIGSSHLIPPEVPLVWDLFEPPPAGRTSLWIHCSGPAEHRKRGGGTWGQSELGEISLLFVLSFEGHLRSSRVNMMSCPPRIPVTGYMIHLCIS